MKDLCVDVDPWWRYHLCADSPGGTELQMVVFLGPRHVLSRFIVKHIGRYRIDWAMAEKALSSPTNMIVGA